MSHLWHLTNYGRNAEVWPKISVFPTFWLVNNVDFNACGLVVAWSALSPSFFCSDLLAVSHQTFQPRETLRVQTSRLSLQTPSDIHTMHPCLKPGFISMEDGLGHGEWEGNESRNQEGLLLQQTTCRFSVNVWSACRTMVPVSGWY